MLKLMHEKIYKIQRFIGMDTISQKKDIFILEISKCEFSFSNQVVYPQNTKDILLS